MNDLIKTELNFVNSARISAGVTDYDTLEPDDHNEINGGVLSDTRLSWVTCGPRLTIINNNDGSIRNGWTFGRIQRDSTVKVTCVVELPLENPSSPILIVGCESAISGGTVCFYHTGSSRVLKAIHFNEKVTSLAVVHSNDEPNPHLVRFIKPWSGVVAVGTKLGAVYLIDLWRNGLDKCISDYHFRTYDELHVSQLSLITLEQLDPSLDYRKRSTIQHGGSTPAIFLNGGVLMKQGTFENVHRTKSSCVLSRFPRDQLVVTAIQFFPKICTLAVGYNISCFQLWDLTDFNLLYTSALMEAKLPVCRFGLLEPSDDPRYVCFLWSFHQSSGHQQSLPFGAMYLLNYDSKQNITNYGNLYQDFSSCSLRYEMDFGDEIPSVEDGRIISCRTINKVIPKTIPYSLKDEDASIEESSLSLIAITWEVWSQNRIQVSNCMTVFDLNQWYQEHMPNSTLTEYDGYMTHLTLKQFEEDTLLDVRIIEQSLKPYIALYHLDQHYYPSSLSFDCVCLYRLNIVHSSRTGVQKACLNAIEMGGPTALLNPTPLFKLCDLAGVKPLLADIHVNYLNNTSVKDQRELVLSVALENSMNGFLWRCVQEWSDGSHAVAGSTLPALLSWAWSRVTLYKLTADNLCVPLFDYTGVRLDFNDRLTLEHCVRQLRNLSKLFRLVIDKFRSFILHDNLEQQYTALSLVSLYLDAVLWFLRNGVLPETLDGDDLSFYSNHHVPYLMNRITGSTKARRVELEHIASSLKTKPPSSGLFFIDALIEQECGGSHLTNQWELEGGATTLGKYPPPSVQSLLRIYLLRGIPTLYKHYVVLYFILDVINHLDSKRYNKHIEKLLMFPTMFGLTESQSRIIQAFWDMDHKHFEEAVDHLLHPNVCKQDLQCYQHRTILCLLVSEGKHKLALRYLNLKKPPLSDDEDIKFEMSLLLSNGLIHEAFSFQRQHQSLQKELLHQFFSKCVEMKKIDAVYKLPLNTDEEMGFTTFLELSQHPKGDDLSVYYLVSRSRYLEAIDLHNKLRSVAASRHRLSKPTPGLTPVGPRGFNIFGTKDNLASGAPNESGLTTRDLIINAISKTLPSITKELAEHCAKEKPVFTSSKRVQRPTPLSVVVHTEILSDRLPRYKTSSSKLMEAALAKTRETWAPLLATPTALKSRLKSYVDDIPFLRTPSGRHRYNPSNLNHTLSPVMEGKTKRQLQDNSDYRSKRSRIETMITEDITETANHDFSCSDSLLLVKTPHVPRAVTSRIKSVLTPQSILKTEGKKTNHMTSISLLSTPETRNVGEEDIVSAKSTPSGRQIRFSLPNEESSSSPSLEETDLSPNVTPRKPLHRNSMRLSTQSHDLTPGNPRLRRTSTRNSHLNTSLESDINSVENELFQSSSHKVSFSPVSSDDVYFSLSSSSSKNTLRDSSSSKDSGLVRSNIKCNLSFGVDEEDVDIDSNEFEPVECVNRSIIGSIYDRKSLIKSRTEIISDDISSDESELENVDNNETLKAPQGPSLYSVLSNSVIEKHRIIQNEDIESSAEDVSDKIDNISEDSNDQVTEKSEINIGVKTFQSPLLQTLRSAYETRSFTLNRSLRIEETPKEIEVKSLSEVDVKEFENIADGNESLISEDQSFENKSKPNADQILKITEHSISKNLYDFTVADQNVSVQDNVDETKEIISSEVVDEEFETIPKDNESSISEDQSVEELKTKESLKTLQSSLLHTSIPAYNKFIFGDPNRSVRDELNQNKSFLLDEKPDVVTKVNDIENQQLKADVDRNVLIESENIEIEGKGNDQEKSFDKENFGAEEISSIEDVKSGDSVKEVENDLEIRTKDRTMQRKKKSKPVRTTLSMSLPVLSTPRNDSFYDKGARNKIGKVKGNKENNKSEMIVKGNEEVKSVMINEEEEEDKSGIIEKEEINSKMVVSSPKKKIPKNCDNVVVEESLEGIDNTLENVKQTKLDFPTVEEIDAESKSVDDIHTDVEEFDMSLRLDDTFLDSSSEISENIINDHQKILKDKNITQGIVASNAEVNTVIDTINTAHSLELVKISVSVETVKLPKTINNQISTEDIQNLPSTSANVDIELLQESGDENDKVCLIQSAFTVENPNENLFSSDDLQIKEHSLEVCSVLEDEDIKEQEEEKTYESLKPVYQESDDILGPGDVEESQNPEDDYYNEQGIYEDLIGDDYDQEDEGEKEIEIGREEEYSNQSGSSDVICLDSNSDKEASPTPRPKTKRQKQEHEEYDELYGGLDDDELDYDEYSPSKNSGEELYEEDNENEEPEEEYEEEEEEQEEEEEEEEYSETGSSSSESIIEESICESPIKGERSWKEERQSGEESDEELLEKSDTINYTSDNKKSDKKIESEVTEMVMKISDNNNEEILVSNDKNKNILGKDSTVNDNAQVNGRKESNEECLELQNQQNEVEEIMYEDIEVEQNSKAVDIKGNELFDKIKYKDDECIELSQESKKEEKMHGDIVEVIEKEQIINTVDNKVIELIGKVQDIDEEYISLQNKETNKEENIHEDIAEIIIEEGQISNIFGDKISELSAKIKDIDEEYIAVQNNEKNIAEIIEEEQIVAVDIKDGKINYIDEEYEKVQSQESKKEEKMDEEIVDEKISQVEVVDKTKTLKYLETLGPSTSRGVQGVGMDIINTHLRIVKMFFENMKDVKTNINVVSTTPLIDISQIVENYKNVSTSTIPIIDITETMDIDSVAVKQPEFIDDQFTRISTVGDETQSSSSKEVIKTDFILKGKKITDDHISVIPQNHFQMLGEYDIQSTSADKVISEVSGSNVESITKEDVVNVGKEDLQITISGELKECNILSGNLPEEVVICEEIKTNNKTLESNIIEQHVDNAVETKRSDSKSVMDKEVKEVESDYDQEIKNEHESQVRNISCKEEISVSNKEQCLNEINNREKNASKDLIQVVNEKEKENFNQKESITENNNNERKIQLTEFPLDMVTLREKVREKHVETGSLSALKRHNLRRRSYSDSRNISNKKDNIKLSRKSISVTSILEEVTEGTSFKMVGEQSNFCPQDNAPNIEEVIKYTDSNTESLNVSGIEVLPNLTKENLDTVLRTGRRSSISSQQSQSGEKDSDKESLSEINSIMVEVGSTISDVNSINKTSFHIEPNLNMDQVRTQPRYDMQRRTRSMVKRRLSSLSNIKEIPELTTDNQGSLFKSASTNNVSTENEKPLCRPLKRRCSSVTTWLEFKKAEESNQVTTGLSSGSSSYSQLDNHEVFEDPEVKLDRHRQRLRNFRRLSLASYRQSLPRRSSVSKLEELEVVTSSDEDEITVTKRLKKIKSVPSSQQPANSIDSVVSIAGSSHVPSIDQQSTEVVENVYDSDQKSSRSKIIRSKSVPPQIEIEQVESVNLNNKNLRKKRAASEEIRPITRISIKSKGIQTRKWLKQQQIYQAMSNRLTGRSSVLKQNLEPLEVIESDEEIIAVVPSGSHRHQTVLKGKKDKDDENITEELVSIEEGPGKVAGEDRVEQAEAEMVVKAVLKRTKKGKPTKIAKAKITKIHITPPKKLQEDVDKGEKSVDKELKILEPEEETNKHSKKSKVINKPAKNRNGTFTQKEEEQVNKNSSVSETHTNYEERETTSLKKGKNKKSMSNDHQKSQKISTEIHSSNDGGNQEIVNENSELIKKFDEVKQIDKDQTIEIKNLKKVIKRKNKNFNLTKNIGSNPVETSDTVEEQAMDVDDKPLQALPEKSPKKTKINQKKVVVPEKKQESRLIEGVHTKGEIVTSPTTPKRAKLRKERAKPNTKNKISEKNVIVEHSNVILETDKSKEVASNIETEEDNEDHNNIVITEIIKRKRGHPEKNMEVVSENKIETNKKGVEKLKKDVKTKKKSKNISRNTDESLGTVVNENEINEKIDVNQRKKVKSSLEEQTAVEKQSTTKLTDNLKIGQTGDNEDYESDVSSTSTVRTKVKTIWKQDLDKLDSPASRTRRRSAMSDTSSVDSKASTIIRIDENVSTPERRVTRRRSLLETSGMVTPDTPQSSLMDDYTSQRRLTRKQLTLLSRSMESSPNLGSLKRLHDSRLEDVSEESGDEYNKSLSPASSTTTTRSSKRNQGQLARTYSPARSTRASSTSRK